MLYFAYGSNLDPKQMRRRCPSHRFIAVACLPDHRLDFTRRSPRRRCGTADVVAAPGEQVWGVVYRVAHPHDIATLDRAEGYDADNRWAHAYWRKPGTVILQTAPPRACRVEVYLARRQKNPPPPSRAYMGHMLRGARHWGLPADYIAALEQVPVDPVRLS